MRIVRIIAVVLLSLSPAIGAYAGAKLTPRSIPIPALGDSPASMAIDDSIRSVDKALTGLWLGAAAGASIAILSFATRQAMRQPGSTSNAHPRVPISPLQLAS